MASYLHLKKKNLEKEKDMIHEKIQKTEKCSKNVIILSRNLNCIFGQENVEI